MPRAAGIALRGTCLHRKQNVATSLHFFQEAMRYRTLGWVKDEEVALRQAIANAAPATVKGRLVAREAREHLSLLLCQTGRAEAADAQLSTLDYRVRLSDCILNYDRPELSASKAPGSLHSDIEMLSGMRVFDNAIPEDCLQTLIKALAPLESPYWLEHRYPEDVDFFSYMFDLATKPSNAVEELILCLKPLVAQHFPEIANARSAEWWVHSRSANQWWGHPLHYDMNEHSLGTGLGFSHPAVSSVIFLTEPPSSSFGPTAVLQQRFGGSMANEAGLVFPRMGRLLLFDGQLLHGVLPGKPWEEPRKHTHVRPGLTHHTRLTLMVGWWTVPIEKLPRPRQCSFSERVAFGSNMEAPLAEDNDWIWPSTLPVSNTTLQAPDQIRPTKSDTLVVSPVWQHIERGRDSPQNTHNNDGQHPATDNGCGSENQERITDNGSFGLIFLSDEGQVDREVRQRLGEARTSV